MRDCLDAGVRRIWFHRGSGTRQRQPGGARALPSRGVTAGGRPLPDDGAAREPPGRTGFTDGSGRREPLRPASYVGRSHASVDRRTGAGVPRSMGRHPRAALGSLPHMAGTVLHGRVGRAGGPSWSSARSRSPRAARPPPPVEQPDFAVRDVAVVVRSEEPFTRATDFPARVESTLEAALDYWGGAWSDLAGRSITFEGKPDRHLRRTTPERSAATTATSGSPPAIPAFPFSCVEQTVLVHEVGHAVIGDAAPRGPALDGLRSRDGEAGRAAAATPATAESRLQALPSVWQHPPDRR